MTVCAYSLKKYTCFKENYFSFGIFSFKIDRITLDPDPDPYWGKILDPDRDPNSMYWDPQH